jgi:hypothetical protein
VQGLCSDLAFVRSWNRSASHPIILAAPIGTSEVIETMHKWLMRSFGPPCPTSGVYKMCDRRVSLASNPQDGSPYKTLSALC